MGKSDISTLVLNIVSSEAEIGIDKLLSRNRRREVVDARSIAIHILSRDVLYPNEIAGLFKISIRNVYHILSGFDARLQFSPPMRYCFERIKNRLRQRNETRRQQSF